MERETTILNLKSDIEKNSTKKKRNQPKDPKKSLSSNSHWSPSTNTNSPYSEKSDMKLTIPLVADDVSQNLKTENFDYIPVTPVEKEEPSFEINDAKESNPGQTNRQIHVIEEAESSEDEAYSEENTQDEAFETHSMPIIEENSSASNKVENEEDFDIDHELEEINKPKIFLLSEEDKSKTKEFFKQQTKKKLDLVLKKKDCLEGLIKMRKGECIKMLGEKVYKEVMDFFSDKIKVSFISLIQLIF